MLLTLMVGVLSVCTSNAQAAKPNIVLMVMDNLGWGAIGVYGGGILRGAETPRLATGSSTSSRIRSSAVVWKTPPILPIRRRRRLHG
jgi:arylsulfatase